MIDLDKMIEEGLGVEITLKEDKDYTIIKETLSRMGIMNYKQKELYQSCHVLSKDGRYFVLHFKELFFLIGNKSTIDFKDLCRRNRIVNILVEWGLCGVVNQFDIKDMVHPSSIRILKHKDKEFWKLRSKFAI